MPRKVELDWFSLGGLGCRQPIRGCCLSEVYQKEAANHSRAAITSLVIENEANQPAYSNNEPIAAKIIIGCEIIANRKACVCFLFLTVCIM